MKGDIHDIGKNIVKVLLENYGYCLLYTSRCVEETGRIVPMNKGFDKVTFKRSAVSYTHLQHLYLGDVIGGPGDEGGCGKTVQFRI